MIEYIKGELAELSPALATVEAAGVGYGLNISLNTYSALQSTSPKQGRKEGPACIKFALMMAEYCLSQQIKTFGEALRNEYVSAQDECQRYGANHSVFDQLAPTFTIDDLRALKRGYCSETAMRMIISRWMRDGWISKTDRHHWSKRQVGPTAENVTK